MGAQATIVVWEGEKQPQAHTSNDRPLSWESFELLFNEEKHQVLPYLSLGTKISNFLRY